MNNMNCSCRNFSSYETDTRVIFELPSPICHCVMGYKLDVFLRLYIPQETDDSSLSHYKVILGMPFRAEVLKYVFLTAQTSRG